MITFINISDIHFSESMSNTQSIYLDKFFEDLNNQCREFAPSKLYLIISGDLVQAGIFENFNAFKDNFIKKIIDKIGIPEQNMIFVPGNHDLNREYISEKYIEFSGFLTPPDKDTFIHYLCTPKFDESILSKKFVEYIKFYQSLRPDFCKTDKTDITGYELSINENIHILCLNSALCSFGGLNDIDDRTKGLLSIDTEKVAKWLTNVKGKSGLKIIIMHHPHEYLSVWARDELRILLKNVEKLCILYGHTHNQDIGKYINESNDILYCTAPQLFSNNTQDLFGYSIINIDDSIGNIQYVKYREWNYRNQCFLNGRNFAKNDGVVSFIENQEVSNYHRTPSSLNIKEYDKLTDRLLTDDSLITDNYVFVIRSLEKLKDIVLNNSKLKERFYVFLCTYIQKRMVIQEKELYIKELEWLSLPYNYKINSALPYDIQLAFILLFKDCSAFFESICQKVDFSKLALYNISFSGMNVKNVSFSQAMLQHASMFKVDKLQLKSTFDNCNFDNAFMDAANMSEATFYNCSFVHTNMRWANMYGVQFNKCIFKGCQMTGVVLSEAHISDCIFENCKIDGSELMNIHFETPIVLKECSFCYASIFSDSMFKRKNVKFESCDFTGAENDLKYYDGYGRIKRFLIYRKNIQKNDSFEDLNEKPNSHKSGIEDKKSIYYSVMRDIRDYCLPNGFFAEDEEIRHFVEGRTSKI